MDQKMTPEGVCRGKSMKIALVGCGSIGAIIAQAISDGKLDVELKYVYDSMEEKGKEFAKKFGTQFKNFDDILKEDLDLVIEAASQEAVKVLVLKILDAKKNVMIMSAGALADDSLLQKIKALADKNKLKIYLPSGAIAGLDGVKSANMDDIETVTLITTKPVKSLKDAPFFMKNKINPDDIKTKTIIYNGYAKEAAVLFPENINVATSLSLAGIGIEKTKVQVIADPNIERNMHEIKVEGKFGVLTVRTENLPSKNNPKTSYLAALSAIATIKKITEPIQVGT